MLRALAVTFRFRSRVHTLWQSPEVNVLYETGRCSGAFKITCNDKVCNRRPRNWARRQSHFTEWVFHKTGPVNSKILSLDGSQHNSLFKVTLHERIYNKNRNNRYHGDCVLDYLAAEC